MMPSVRHTAYQPLPLLPEFNMDSPGSPHSLACGLELPGRFVLQTPMLTHRLTGR